MARRKCRPRTRLLAGVRAYGRRKSALTLRLKRRHAGRTNGRSKPYMPRDRKPAMAASAPRPSAKTYGDAGGKITALAGTIAGVASGELDGEMAGVVDGETAGVLVGRSEAALGGVLTGTVATAAVAIASVVACGVVLAVGSGTKLATISPAVINSSGASPVVTNTCSRNW